MILKQDLIFYFIFLIDKQEKNYQHKKWWAWLSHSRQKVYKGSQAWTKEGAKHIPPKNMSPTSINPTHQFAYQNKIKKPIHEIKELIKEEFNLKNYTSPSRLPI